MKKNRILFGVIALLTVFAMTMTSCDDGGGNTDSDWSASANGAADTTTSTKITFTFDKDVSGLTANDITIDNGTGQVTKGSATGSGKNWELGITVATQGNVSITISKSGVKSGPKTVAVYKAETSSNTFTVTFHANKPPEATADVTGMPADITNQAEGTAIGAKTNPSLTGYTFGGWYQNAEGTGNAWVLATAPVTSELNLYAKWTEQGGPGPSPISVTAVQLGEFTYVNTDAQKGWNSNGVSTEGGEPLPFSFEFEDLAAAKYLVLETKGSSNPAGFGGIQIVLQGNGNAWDWTGSQTDVISGFVGFAHTEEETVYIVIQLDQMGRHSDFVTGTQGRIIVCSYPALDGLGLQEAYLVIDEFAKPEGAADTTTGGYIVKDIEFDFDLIGTGTTTYTVTFDADGGTPAPPVQPVEDGGKALEPPEMTKSGHSFGGWYKEAALTNAWNFDTDIIFYFVLELSKIPDWDKTTGGGGAKLILNSPVGWTKSGSSNPYDDFTFLEGYLAMNILTQPSVSVDSVNGGTTYGWFATSVPGLP